METALTVARGGRRPIVSHSPDLVSPYCDISRIEARRKRIISEIIAPTQPFQSHNHLL